MPRGRINPDQFEGPFLGLATSLSPQQLSIGHATIARNVYLSEGRIRPRAPWMPVRGLDGQPVKLIGAVQSLFTWYPPVAVQGLPAGGLRPWYLAKTDLGHLYMARDGADPLHLDNDLSNKPVQFVPFGNAVYAIDETRPRRIQGVASRPAGMTAPNPTPWSAQSISDGSGLAAGTYTYRVSAYDSVTGVESNAVDVTSLGGPLTTAGGYSITGAMINPGDFPLDPTTHFRLYRRHLPEIWWRLVAELAWPGVGPVGYTDRISDENVLLSNTIAGPWAPIRNNVPPFSRGAIAFAGRMWYVDRSLPRIYFSAVGSPDYVHPNDWVDYSGDADERISGLGVRGNELLVGKPRSIHVSTGLVSTPTNDTVATDAQAPEGTFVSRRTRSTVGPAFTQGSNPFVSTAEPGRTLFAAETGFYEFDGESSQPTTDENRPLWEDFLLGGLALPTGGFIELSAAVDEVNGLLALCVCDQFHRRETSKVLFFHHRGGVAWTRADAAAETVTHTPVPGTPLQYPITPTCVASAGADRQPVTGGSIPPVTLRTGFAGMLIGTEDGFLLVSDDNPADSEQTRVTTPDWEWETGDLALRKGMRTHVHALKLISTPALRVLPDASMVELRVVPDGRMDKAVSKTATLTDNPAPNVGVGLTGRTFRIRLKKAAGTVRGYDRGFGIIGIAPDLELSGQR